MLVDSSSMKIISAGLIPQTDKKKKKKEYNRLGGKNYQQRIMQENKVWLCWHMMHVQIDNDKNCDTMQKWTFFLYHVDYEVEVGVCVCVFVCPDLNVGGPTRVKLKKEKERFFSLLRCQITGWAQAATKSGFDFMPQRDQTGRFFSTNKF